MSFAGHADTVQIDGEPLWSRYRDCFPVTQYGIYLNHAAVAPLSKPAATAMANLAHEVANCGSLHYDSWLDAYEGVRVAAARLLGAHRDEIALVKNTSEGIATVALGFPWKAGDTVVTFREEFPANLLPWLKLQERGVRVQSLSIFDSLDRIEAATRDARLLAISFVNYFNGLRVDLKAIGEICRRHETFFFVDAIQALGAFPVDVEECRIDALASDGHKWMLGPEGCGILYIRRERLSQIQPVEFGWTNVEGFNDYGARDMTLRPDAGRYECGTLNTVGCFGLRASLDLLLEIGDASIGPAVSALADQLAAGAERKGYQLAVPRAPENSAGIVAIRKDATDSEHVVEILGRARIQAATRQGWVRLSPHFYLSPEEIAAAVEALP